ncbi:Gfo/Idh/MocA family protein [Alkalibacterium olivapovliticus]|uniref:Putative dehydrogenase n=1 Tax=Alkalibacterium olivapovliticus TaxID=99907 RepID=A0A2T0W688_9LACT|nr:Gfo/Idh/MocA family oxidoreductase [Alkalibacterium olivapovliticus]PRY82227.1 putative dehydrogenase [Alkalibacterium olivapovliticus]
MNDNKKLRVGIIGLGDVSPIHIQAIEMSEHAELVAACDTDPSLKSVVEGTPFYSNFKEMLSEQALDVVHNCLPHHLHYPVTKACIEAGVHVFLEKPVSISYEEGKFQKQLEDNSGLKICVCFQNRYNATFLKLQDYLNKKETGKVTGIKALVTWYREDSYYKTKPWRRTKAEVGYGNIMSQSIHTLDLVQLLGGQVTSVKATLSKLLDVDSEVEDTASAVFTFSSGSRGYFHATNANVDNSSVELQVNTENETFTIKDSRLYRLNSEGEKEQLAVDDTLEGIKFYFGASHKLLIDRFYKAILEDTDDYVSVEDALPSIHLIEMMAESSKTVVEPITVLPKSFKS